MPETTVETKNCKNCGISFEITDADIEFYDKISLVFDGKKFQIPIPTLCPDCRQQRRLMRRNERSLYKRKCDFSSKEVISNYPENSEYTIYDSEIRRSDKWDAMDYGIDFDFNKIFFEQFDLLLKKVPQMSLLYYEIENSPYTNFTAYSKGIFMCYDVMYCENVFYSATLKNISNSMDCDDVEQCEHCYECLASSNLYNCFYVQFSENCSNSRYLYNCKNLKDSLFCVNLEKKKNYLLNSEVSKEEFNRIKNEILENKDLLHQYKEKYNKLLLELPRQNCKLDGSQNCIGNNLLNSKDSYYCFDSTNLENCRYCSIAHSMKDCMDTIKHNPNCELDYEAISGGVLVKSMFNVICWESNNLNYCYCCSNSSNLFGCVGLVNKEYCIFNKQYTKEEYEKTLAKIIEHMISTGEWGEFFPKEICPFAYNESYAMEYFPLEKNEAIANGFRRKDKEETVNVPKGLETIEAKDLSEPQAASFKPQSILDKAIVCEKSGRLFRIIKPELDFYIKHKLPLPRKHPDIRHIERVAYRQPMKLYDSKCAKCGVDIKTTYSPDRSEVVYCEQCYEKEVY